MKYFIESGALSVVLKLSLRDTLRQEPLREEPAGGPLDYLGVADVHYTSEAMMAQRSAPHVGLAPQLGSRAA